MKYRSDAWVNRIVSLDDKALVSRLKWNIRFGRPEEFFDTWEEAWAWMRDDRFRKVEQARDALKKAETRFKAVSKMKKPEAKP